MATRRDGDMRKMVRAVGVGGGDDSAGERKRSAGEGKRPPSAAREAEASKLRRMADEWGGGGGGREGAAAGECDCSASVGAGRMGGEWELLFTQGKGSFAFQFCTSLLESVLPQLYVFSRQEFRSQKHLISEESGQEPS